MSEASDDVIQHALQTIAEFEETYKQPIDPSTVSRVLSPRFVFLDTLHTHQLSDKRRRTEQWPEPDQALFEWIQRAEGQITISQEVRPKSFTLISITNFIQKSLKITMKMKLCMAINSLWSI